jgi:hypothetical protein
MVYYLLQSWQNYLNGCTTGEEVLKEEQGTTIPEDSYCHNGTGFTNNEYFSTYEEARARFDYILECYRQYPPIRDIHIERRDEVKGERTFYDA